MPAPTATLPSVVPISTAPPAAPVAATQASESDPVPSPPARPATPSTAAAPIVLPDRVTSAPAPTASARSLTWLWLLALGGLLLAWWTAWRHSQRLREETERLARQQRVLKSAHSHLQRKSQELQHLSMHDPLTGALNRQAFGVELRDRIDHLAKYNLPLSLIVFDLDHFKQINDRHGHLVGDTALALVVGVVREHLVSDDVFGRFGGDEFMVACPGQTAAQALVLADTLRQAVVTRAPLADPPIPGLTLSLGVAQADPEQGYDVDDLFARADAALYLAKQRGRNACVAADGGTVAQAVPGSVRRHL
ncbi:GGDEF domain-containing protein [Dyella ginsengisoli]|uniref:diguanylate cyclase n=1 Tax=Dyella ginsengisoli TaxID=363848 RepID=A0ABW8JYX1_9GAMM